MFDLSQCEQQAAVIQCLCYYFAPEIYFWFRLAEVAKFWNPPLALDGWVS